MRKLEIICNEDQNQRESVWRDTQHDLVILKSLIVFLELKLFSFHQSIILHACIPLKYGNISNFYENPVITHHHSARHCSHISVGVHRSWVNNLPVLSGQNLVKSILIIFNGKLYFPNMPPTYPTLIGVRTLKILKYNTENMEQLGKTSLKLVKVF